MQAFTLRAGKKRWLSTRHPMYLCFCLSDLPQTDKAN